MISPPTHILKSKALSQFPQIYHGTSTKQGPPIPIKQTPDKQALYINQHLFSQKTGIPTDAPICIGNQCHGNTVATIASLPDYIPSPTTPLIPTTDALITNLTGIYLAIHTADCLPVFFYDPEKNSIGIAHAGWRGVVSDIVPKTVQAMQVHYNSEPKDIIVYIGPSICPKHYPVDDEVADIFVQKFPNQNMIVVPADVLIENSGQKKYALDLMQATKVQLMASGVLDSNIEKSGICTWEQTDLLSSARREGVDRADTNWSVIGLV